MKSNAELKAEAKEMLAGRWKESIMMCLVPTLLSLAIAMIIIFFVAVPTFIAFNDFSTSLQTAPGSTTIIANGNTGSSPSGSSSLFGGIIGAFFAAGITWTFLDVLRGKKVIIDPFKDIFRGFRSPYALGILVIYLLSTIFTVLWSMLFVIPGIIKAYAYSQATNIYYDTYENTGETPGYLATITASRQLMNGYKAQLFLLDLSFIGWHILAVLTLGIGYLWLTPYINATKAAFYNNLPK